jgi:hypothetical protein
MDKKFTIGLIALLGVSLFFLGCDDSSDDSTTEHAKEPTLALTLGQPSWTAETPNKENVNEMLGRLWSAKPASEVQNITQGQVFSWATTTLTVKSENITDDLKTWVITQWGGTSVPVKASVNKGALNVDVDTNWGGAHLIWIDLETVSDAPAYVELTDGSKLNYTVDVQP